MVPFTPLLVYLSEDAENLFIGTVSYIINGAAKDIQEGLKQQQHLKCV